MTPATADLALVAALVVAGFAAGGRAHSLVLDSYAAYLFADAALVGLVLTLTGIPPLAGSGRHPGHTTMQVDHAGHPVHCSHGAAGR